MASKRGGRHSASQPSLTLRNETRYSPYSSQRSFTRAMVSGASSSSIPPVSSAPNATVGTTWRDVCLKIISKRLPGFEPRNDFEILVLGTTHYTGTRAELGTWLDGKFASQLRMRGSLEGLMEQTRDTLAAPSSTISGLKPQVGESNPQVFVRPIPKSRYSIRLFPGCLEAQEYCLDFVDTRTGVPVNSPFKFELWQISADPSTPWSSLMGAVRIRSLENAFGYSQDKIPPGEEKFLLRDGDTCLLKRPGHKDVRFTVPRRPLPPPTPVAAVAATDVDVLDLPSETPAV